MNFMISASQKALQTEGAQGAVVPNVALMLQPPLACLSAQADWLLVSSSVAAT